MPTRGNQPSPIPQSSAITNQAYASLCMRFALSSTTVARTTATHTSATRPTTVAHTSATNSHALKPNT